MNKKGQDKMLSMYWFAIIFLVAAAIVYMVVDFYSHPYNVRELETELLANQVADCISRGGKLNTEVFSKGKFNEEFENNFFEVCNLNFDSGPQWNEEIQYYVELDFFDVGDVFNSLFNLKKGNLNLVTSCEIKDEDYEKLAKCFTKRFYVASGDRQFLVELKSVVRKTEKNVK